jgi:hypothetical protein
VSDDRDSLLTEEEKQALRQKVLDQLEAEHQERLNELEDRKKRAAERRGDRTRRRKEAEEAELRDQVREEYYAEKGYELYIDRSGHKKWIPKEELEWRMRRRRTRRKDNAPMSNQARSLVFYAATTLIALLLGLYLLR